MLGVNPGLIWSLATRPHRYYRTFEIPKGRGTRTITAPRVALKIIQKWLGYHLARAVPLPKHVYGFVPGRSHIEAAYVHQGAEWALSVDIENFFQTTPASLVQSTFRQLGYNDKAADLLTSLTCYQGVLAQGAPSSPTLSNLCFVNADAALMRLSERYACRITRYADDIVLSGQGGMPATLRKELHCIFDNGPWRLSSKKEIVQPIRGRIKVYGLIVNRPSVRLTKGYRNKIRAYKHILAKYPDRLVDCQALVGHVLYSKHVNDVLERLSNSDT